jgi:hypothetical protein
VGHSLPSGKSIGSFETYDAMLNPFVQGGAIMGRSKTISGELIVRDPEILLKMAMMQSPSPTDILRLNLV